MATATKKTAAKKADKKLTPDIAGLDKALDLITKMVQNPDPTTSGHKVAITQAKRFLTQHGVKV